MDPFVNTNYSSGESTPLLAQISADERELIDPMQFSNSAQCSRPLIMTALYSLPAVILALVLNLLEAVSYGMIIFPAASKSIPKTAASSGISMFLVSTIVSQLVFTFGGSAFKGAIGSMMIEVMPFLQIMCRIIETRMSGRDSKSILATIMCAYSMSCVMTGLVFLLLGLLKLGNLIQFFPRHILIGCIGGIGLFLLVRVTF